ADMVVEELVERLPARDRQEAWNWVSWSDGYLDEFLQQHRSLSEDTHLRDELTFVLFLWWVKRKYADSFRGYEESLRFLGEKGLEAFAFGQRGIPYSTESSLTI